MIFFFDKQNIFHSFFDFQYFYGFRLHVLLMLSKSQGTLTISLTAAGTPTKEMTAGRARGFRGFYRDRTQRGGRRSAARDDGRRAGRPEEKRRPLRPRPPRGPPTRYGVLLYHGGAAMLSRGRENFSSGWKVAGPYLVGGPTKIFRFPFAFRLSARIGRLAQNPRNALSTP